MKTEPVDITTLVADPKNARVHSPRNIAAIADSLKAFGQRRPVVARRGSRIVIAGNGMVEAAKKLRLKVVDVLWVDDDDQAATAYALADNRTGELAAWDYETLAELAGEAGDSLIGWTPEELAGLGAAQAAKASINAGYRDMGSKPASVARPSPVAMMIMPDALAAVQAAIEREIGEGRAMSASEALIKICKGASDGRKARSR